MGEKTTNETNITLSYANWRRFPHDSTAFGLFVSSVWHQPSHINATSRLNKHCSKDHSCNGDVKSFQAAYQLYHYKWNRWQGTWYCLRHKLMHNILLLAQFSKCCACINSGYSSSRHPCTMYVHNTILQYVLQTLDRVNPFSSSILKTVHERSDIPWNRWTGLMRLVITTV